MTSITTISDSSSVIAVIIPASYSPEKTEFLTPDTYKQQVGFVVYPCGGEIVPHIHHEMERNLRGTSEVLFVKEGRCVVDFYRQDKSFISSSEISTGDILILVGGGHGFRMLEATTFIEVKQGPYVGVGEKERFDRPVGVGS